MRVWFGIALGLALEAACVISLRTFAGSRAERACEAIGGRVERMESEGRFALVPGRAFCLQPDGRRVPEELWGGWTGVVRLAALGGLLLVGFTPLWLLNRRHFG